MVSLGKGTLSNFCGKTDACQIWLTQPDSANETLAQNLVDPDVMAPWYCGLVLVSF
jgi:hypothetical protein